MNYEEKYINILKEIVLKNIDLNNYIVFLFGSRAGNSNNKTADVDIGFYGNSSLGKYYHKIINEIEESIVPYKVDLVDFKLVNENFKKEALKNIKIWNKPAGMEIN